MEREKSPAESRSQIKKRLSPRKGEQPKVTQIFNVRLLKQIHYNASPPFRGTVFKYRPVPGMPDL